MKNIIFCCLLTLIPSLAFAFPKVGDYVRYVSAEQKADRTPVAVMEEEIVDYDQDEGLFTVVKTTTIEGVTEKNEEKLTLDDLADEETMQYVLDNCATIGGRITEITVPAGKLNTCHVTITDEDVVFNVWYAMVPMGMAKASITEGSEAETTWLLAEFRNGK